MLYMGISREKLIMVGNKYVKELKKVQAVLEYLEVSFPLSPRYSPCSYIVYPHPISGNFNSFPYPRKMLASDADATDNPSNKGQLQSLNAT